jgi:polyhydroxyalkanoate synthesis repressor PhaR
VQRTKKRAVPSSESVAPPAGVTLIKKYGNRRLYDTRRSRYITLEELTEFVALGEEVRVTDAKTAEDLTKRVLTRIILREEERRRLNLLPLGFLRQLIQNRGNASVEDFYQKYLTLSLEVFMKGQRELERPPSREIDEMRSRIDNLEAKLRVK